jgi:hypothetical protein
MANFMMSFMEADMMRKTARPPYSHDLAPPDFFLFADVKGRLSEYSFSNDDELPGPIYAILAAFEAETLNRVFCEWMRRFQQCIETRGEYVRWPKQ